MERILDCFLENGAVLNDINDGALVYRPLAVSLFAKKSILHLEEMSPTAILYRHGNVTRPYYIDVCNAIIVMMLKHKIYGSWIYGRFMDQTTVTEIHTILQENMTNGLPDKFLPLETLYEMTGQAPTLQQSVRRDIWKRLAESGNTSRENIERLGVEFGLPRVLMDYVQADNLGLEVDAIMAPTQEWE